MAEQQKTPRVVYHDTRQNVRSGELRQIARTGGMYAERVASCRALVLTGLKQPVEGVLWGQR